MEVRMNGFTPNDSLLRHWNVLWNELEPGRKTGPATDVVEDADAYHFYFEMAGINSASVNVRVEDSNLIVEAERKRPEWSKDAEVHLSERAYGTMRRAFTTRAPATSFENSDLSTINIRAGAWAMMPQPSACTNSVCS